jgi:undecaprenyl-diphosphatase
MTLDVGVFRWLNGLAGEVEPFDQVIRLLAGDHLLPVLSVVSLIWLWLAGTDRDERVEFQRGAFDGLLALGLASPVTSLLALILARARPFVDLRNVEMLFYAPTDYSFPAQSVAVLVGLGTAVRSAHRRIGNVVLTAGLVLGLTPVIAGVHWPSDVLGGIVVGLAAGLSAHWLPDRLGPVSTWLTRALPGVPANVANSDDETTQRALRH